MELLFTILSSGLWDLSLANGNMRKYLMNVVQLASKRNAWWHIFYGAWKVLIEVDDQESCMFQHVI